MDLARGEYVYFVDDDDWLEPDALERMHATALADGADIVIGKVVGHGKSGAARHLPRDAARASPFDSVRAARAADAAQAVPAADARRARHPLPRGPPAARGPPVRRPRLLPRRTASRCWPTARTTTGPRASARPNASHRPLDPEGYYGNVREVLDLVLEHTEPGPFRDRLLTHWYRGKMLQRVGGAQVHAPRRRPQPPPRRDDPGARARALRRGRARRGWRSTCGCARRCCATAATRTCSGWREFEAGLRAALKVRVHGGGRRLVLELTATLRGLEFERRRRAAALAAAGARCAGVDLDVTDGLGSSQVQVFLHSLRDGGEYVLPGETEVELDPDGRVDPDDARRGRSAHGRGRQPAAGGRLRGPRQRQRRRLLARALGAPQRRAARAHVVASPPRRAARRAAAAADGAPPRRLDSPPRAWSNDLVR